MTAPEPAGVPAIVIKNNGAEIVSTNYWRTEHCTRGLFYLSTNAGCLRLLVPPSQQGHLSDMQTGVREVLLTRGVLDGHEAIEILFEDGSAAPFALHVGRQQADRLWTAGDEGRQWRLAIHTQSGKVSEHPCYLRRAATLPYMRPRTGS